MQVALTIMIRNNDQMGVHRVSRHAWFAGEGR